MAIKPGFTYYLYHWMWNGLDLLFPPICGGCGKKGVRWCDNCQRNLLVVAGPVCDRCGEPQKFAGLCKNCHRSRPPYQALRSWAVFSDPLRPALHKLKYRRDLGLGEVLACSLAEYIETSLRWDIEMVVPVPLSDQRLSERGYNQVALIAQPLAMLERWDYVPKALKRVRHTRSQVGLSIQKRKDNVQNAFKANPRLIADKKILLVDDVATTGATIFSASRCLVEAGARYVYALTAARAVSRYGSDAA